MEKLFKEEDIKNLEKGLELLIKDMHDNNINNKNILYINTEEKNGEYLINTGYYGSIEKLVYSLFSIKNDGIQKFLHTCYETYKSVNNIKEINPKEEPNKENKESKIIIKKINIYNYGK